MKNFIKLLSITILIATFTQNSAAQFKFSAGADIGMVTNENLGFVRKNTTKYTEIYSSTPCCVSTVS